MSERGKPVLDAKRVLHIAAERDKQTLCGTEWAALDLYWQTTTRIICAVCIAVAEGAIA